MLEVVTAKNMRGISASLSGGTGFTPENSKIPAQTRILDSFAHPQKTIKPTPIFC